MKVGEKGKMKKVKVLKRKERVGVVEKIIVNKKI
jgi:hypothetical protein